MPGPIDYTKIRFVADPDTQGWWEGTKQHKLLVRMCNKCGYKWFPPNPACYNCNSMDVGWYETSGKGILACYNTIVQPTLQAFMDTVPYSVALVELPECANPDGMPLRMQGVLREDEGQFGIGDEVEVVWEDTAQEDFVVPRWRVTKRAPNGWQLSE